MKLGVVHKSIISKLGRWRQEDGEFEASLGHIVRSCLKQINHKQQKARNKL
jgi:hypothetical protein